VPWEFPLFQFSITSDSGLRWLALSVFDTTPGSGWEDYNYTDGDLSRLLGVPLEWRGDKLFLGPGAYGFRVTAVDAAGRVGTSSPIQITYAAPDTQPRIQVKSFTMLELGSSFFFYAPDLVVADLPGQSGLQIIGFQVLTIPGLPSPFPTAWAVGLSVPPDQDTPLFHEVNGDFELEGFAPDGRRSTGGEAIVKLTYRDLAGRVYATTIAGPIIPGTPPTTYTSGCGHWIPPGLGGVGTRCIPSLRQAAEVPPATVGRAAW
jgi:hypothetical protein